LLVAFILGIFWKRATAAGAIAAIVGGIVISGILHFGYAHQYGMNRAVFSVATGQSHLRDLKISELPEEIRELNHREMRQYIVEASREIDPVNAVLGPDLNFFHRVVGVLIICAVIHVLVSLLTRPNEEKSRLVWSDLGGHKPGTFPRFLLALICSAVVFGLLGFAMASERLSPTVSGMIAATWTLLLFGWGLRKGPRAQGADASDATPSAGPISLLRNDRFWASILCALAVYMHYYFF
jgi:hypothetical protein